MVPSSGSRFPPGNATCPPCTPPGCRKIITTCSSPSPDRYTGITSPASIIAKPLCSLVLQQDLMRQSGKSAVSENAYLIVGSTTMINESFEKLDCFQTWR